MADLRKTRLEAWQDPKTKPYIRLQNISKDFEGHVALNQLCLDIYQGELFSLLGPSGCGKSTLLRILAGLDTPCEGQVIIDDVDMTHVPAYDRPVNMMFQSYALFPHMNVAQNVAYGLRQDGIKGQELQDKVAGILALVGMESYQKRKPHQLSGGQRQRVALARSLVKQPKLLLLDEPLGALDRQLREKAQFEIVNIQESLGVTCIMVTHDQEEAMTMSTRIGILEDGRLRQVGTPTEIYEYPNGRYVANFVGEMNIFEGIITQEEPDHTLVQCPDMPAPFYISHAVEAPLGGSVAVAIRPEKIQIAKDPVPLERNAVQGIVDDIGYLGDVSIYHVRLASGRKVLASVTNQMRLSERPIDWEDDVYLWWKPESGIILTA